MLSQLARQVYCSIQYQNRQSHNPYPLLLARKRSPHTCFLPYSIALSISFAYSGFLEAARIKEGLVVASSGLYFPMANKNGIISCVEVDYQVIKDILAKSPIKKSHISQLLS